MGMVRSWEELEALAVEASEETSEVDFKQSFDHKKTGDWCEIIKDFIAIANTGGGTIIVGVADDGGPSLFDTDPLAKLDPAVVTDKVKSYAGVDFADFRLRFVKRGNKTAFAFLIGRAAIPIVFTNPGEYQVDGKNKTVFARGTLFFRHGAKSEPANSHDLKEAFGREVGRVREEWLENVRKVVEAPPGARIIVDEGAGAAAPPIKHGRGEKVRLTHDPAAEVVRVIDPNETHPYRQKEVVARLRGELPAGVSITGFDIQAVRTVYSLDSEPSYVYRPKFGSRQYSEAFAQWVLEQVAANPEFFTQARAAYAP